MASVTLHSPHSRVSGDPSGGQCGFMESQELQGEKGRGGRSIACSVNAKALSILETPPASCGKSGLGKTE